MCMRCARCGLLWHCDQVASVLHFKSTKSLQHLKTTNNTNHLQWPVQLCVDMAMQSLLARFFLNDAEVPNDSRSVGNPHAFIVWMIGAQRWAEISGSTSPSAPVPLWQLGLHARGDRRLSTWAELAFMDGMCARAMKLGYRCNNIHLQRIGHHFHLGQCTLQKKPKYLMTELYYELQNSLFLETELRRVLSNRRVVTRGLYDKHQDGDERLEQEHRKVNAFGEALPDTSASWQTKWAACHMESKLRDTVDAAVLESDQHTQTYDRCDVDAVPEGCRIVELAMMNYIAHADFRVGQYPAQSLSGEKLLADAVTMNELSQRAMQDMFIDLRHDIVHHEGNLSFFADTDWSAFCVGKTKLIPTYVAQPTAPAQTPSPVPSPTHTLTTPEDARNGDSTDDCDSESEEDYVIPNDTADEEAEEEGTDDDDVLIFRQSQASNKQGDSEIDWFHARASPTVSSPDSMFKTNNSSSPF
jgi:hypothetical protein